MQLEASKLVALAQVPAPVKMTDQTSHSLPPDAETHSQRSLGKAEALVEPDDDSQKRLGGFSFYMSFISLSFAIILFALELTSVSTALPTIVSALHAPDFVWVGTAYALASTAFVPLTGRLADIFGRKAPLLVSISIFAVGSALCGAAQNEGMLLAGRTLQGIGGGGISAVTNIITGDLVPLRDRGTILAILALSVLWVPIFHLDAHTFPHTKCLVFCGCDRTHCWR